MDAKNQARETHYATLKSRQVVNEGNIQLTATAIDNWCLLV